MLQSVSFFREDLSQLQYLGMFMKESMRLNPPVPSIGRYLNKPLDIANNPDSDVTVPKNVNVALLLLVSNRNPKVWKDPEVINPPDTEVMIVIRLYSIDESASSQSGLRLSCADLEAQDVRLHNV